MNKDNQLKYCLTNLFEYNRVLYNIRRLNTLMMVDNETFFDDADRIFKDPLVNYQLFRIVVSSVDELTDNFVLLGETCYFVKNVDGKYVTQNNYIFPPEYLVGKTIIILEGRPRQHSANSFLEYIFRAFPKQNFYVLLLTPFVLIPAFFTNIFNTRLIFNEDIHTYIFISIVFCSAILVDYVAKLWVKESSLNDLNEQSKKIEGYFLYLLPYANQNNIITKIRTIESSKKVIWESMSGIIVDIVVFVLLISVLLFMLSVAGLALLGFYIFIILLSTYIRYKDYKINLEKEAIQQELLVERISYCRNNKQFLHLNPSFFLSAFERVLGKVMDNDKTITLFNAKWDEFVKACSFFGTIVLFLVIFYKTKVDTNIFNVLIALLVVNSRVSASTVSMVTKGFQMIASAHHLRQSVESLFDGIDKSIFKRGFMLDNIEKISFIDYRLRIQERVLLRNINLEFHKKIIYAISGPVGSGKSSLLKCLTRAMTDFSGDIIFNEQYKIQDVDCNFFHHNVASLDMESDFVSGSIYHNFSIRGQRDKNIITGIVKKIMKDDLVDYEYIFNKDVFSIKMSTGQKRKLLISMALSQSKSIYIFDEVLSNMSNQDILELFREFKSSIDCPFVFIVSHDPSVLNMADVHYEISNGMLKRSKTSVINVGGK